MEERSPITFKRTLVAAGILLVVAAGAAGVYLADRLYYAPMREQQRLIANLKTIVGQLTRDIRMAEVAVVGQTTEPLTTTFKFVEVDANGEQTATPKLFTVAGDVAYFDALVIKFEEPFKPLNELPLRQEELSAPLMNKAIILFRRVFSEKQKPEDGFPLDTPGQPPEPYRGKAPPSAFEATLWSQFWELANDPKLAKEHGVRAAHGQAVYMKLQRGKYYVLEQRLTGDMTIRPLDVPAVLKN
jgi:hypothetical protein